MTIEAVKGIEPISNKEMYYLFVDVLGIFAESKWYKTEEELAYALATNTVRWTTIDMDEKK